MKGRRELVLIACVELPVSPVLLEITKLMLVIFNLKQGDVDNIPPRT